MVKYFSGLPLNTWWPIGTVLLAVGVLVALGTARMRVRRGPRILLALLLAVAVLASAAVGVNAYFGYFRTLGEALGKPPPHETSLARVRAREGARSGHGRWCPSPSRAPSRASWHSLRRFTSAGLVGAPAVPLPVIMLLHGTPGDPTDWVEAGQAQATADGWAATHGGVAPVLVMPDINGSFTDDTECVDSPLGQVETYLTVDVPAAVRANLGTLPPGPAWAIAGLSEGGSCAIMLALRHPDLFATFGDFSGLAGPRVGETNDDTADTVAQLFGGSQQAFAAHEPADLLASGRFSHTGGWFEVGRSTTSRSPAAQQLAPLAPRRPSPRARRRPRRRPHLRLWRRRSAKRCRGRHSGSGSCRSHPPRRRPASRRRRQVRQRGRLRHDRNRPSGLPTRP